MTWHPQIEKQNLGTLMAITSPSSLTCQLTVKKVQSQLQNIDDMLISMIAAMLPNNLASKQTSHLTALMKPGIHACTQALHLAKSPQPQTMPLIAIKTGFKCQ